MISIVEEKPYRFVPPYPGTFWARLARPLLPGYLRRTWGIHEIEFRHPERLEASFRAGHGVMLTPNHARPCDPMVVGLLPQRLGRPSHFVAASHVFTTGGRFQAWLARRMGAYSIHRWGMDRESLKASIQILASARRPLLLFPEGHITRTNDRLGSLLEGTAFIARSAARQRASESSKPSDAVAGASSSPSAAPGGGVSPPSAAPGGGPSFPSPVSGGGQGGGVVVHPVAIRYLFQGDLERAVTPVLEEIEHRLTWPPRRDRTLIERIHAIGGALLALKELEYLGEVRPGSLRERLRSLTEAILAPLETQWFKSPGRGPAVERVKKLRTAILADLVDKDLSPPDRDHLWKQLADCYLAQQLDCYPGDYLAPPTTVDRVLETVERFDEDLTDVARVHGPIKAVVEIGEPIPVDAARGRAADETLMTTIQERLRAMLGELNRECRPYRDDDKASGVA
jgi:1-acyl-sn-glycerol-3-phosphate acyltransferase